MAKSVIYTPIKYAMIYLILTYCFFLITDLSDEIENIEILTGFVLLSYASLFVGYWFGARRLSLVLIPNFSQRQLRSINYLMMIGSCYLFIWGINQIIQFGGTSFSNVWDSLLNPGSAYLAKFAKFEEFEASGDVNRFTQVLVLFGVVFIISIVAFSAYWNRLNKYTKILFISSIFIYLLSFAYIGTQKGLGDVMLLLLAGWSVARARDKLINLQKKINKSKLTRKNVVSIIIIILIAALAITYMSLNQSSRSVEFGINSTMAAKDIEETLTSKLFGKDFALGFYSLLGYPSHGYIGLSHNLTQDFEFSYGAGFSPAFESYRLQYLGGSDNTLLTYPYRTEAATGWPAGMYWSTAFPWFASDLTFFGIFPFMFVLGMMFAKTWAKCLQDMDIFYLGVLGQFFIFIAFLPANNQVLMMRQSLWAIVFLIVIIFSRNHLKLSFGRSYKRQSSGAQFSRLK
jgi:hypothetical protein